MPVYSFQCAACDSKREVIADLATADSIELVCITCGSTMRRAPVLVLNLIGPAIAARKAESNAKAEEMFKPCGHKYQCRCGVKLTEPNPFKQEIKIAHGFVDED